MTLNPWLSLNLISIHAAPAHRQLKNNFSVADDPGAMDKRAIESHPPETVRFLAIPDLQTCEFPHRAWRTEGVVMIGFEPAHS